MIRGGQFCWDLFENTGPESTKEFLGSILTILQPYRRGLKWPRVRFRDKPGSPWPTGFAASLARIRKTLITLCHCHFRCM